MAEKKDPPGRTSEILNAAIKGGLIDAKMPMTDVVDKLGSSIDAVAGYVLAWDKYVVVIADAFDQDVIITRKR
ncbi:MAG TPA: hypothetical protein VKN76_17695 [Kiloniellaceae bacterium]|nr:hypothetical protein [Kiloniellaceae bacterium]